MGKIPCFGQLNACLFLFVSFSWCLDYLQSLINFFAHSSFSFSSSVSLLFNLFNNLQFKLINLRAKTSSSVINQAIKKFTKPLCKSTLSIDVKIKPDNSVVLLFYPPLCFKLSKILKWFNFKDIFKPVNKFHFPSTKSLIPELHKWDIYKVSCKDCNLFYIG